MRLKNNTFGTFPVTLHWPGDVKPWDELIDHFFSQPPQQIGHIADLTIYTWNNAPDECILERSLDHLGIPYVVLGKLTDQWRNMLKIPLFAQALQNTRTKYVMALDGYDLIVIEDLHAAVQRFAATGWKVSFNASRGRWGLPSSNSIEDVIYASQMLKHLNTGAMIGETEFCRDLFAIARDAIPIVRQAMRMLGEGKFQSSDQAVLRAIFPIFHPHIKLDHTCDIFQILDKTQDLSIVD